MLKLTKTGIGLLTRQYRSVLHKCFLINAGLWQAMGDAVSKAVSVPARLVASLLSGGVLNGEAFNVLDEILLSRLFERKLASLTAIGLTIAAATLPSEAEAILLCYDYNTGQISATTGSCPNYTLMEVGRISTPTDQKSSLVLGQDASASGNLYQVVVLGNSATVKASETVAVGGWTKAYGEYSAAIGYDASAKGGYSVALGGRSAIASGLHSTAIGSNSNTYGYGSIALGAYAKAGLNSDDTAPIGGGTTASVERYATAIGAHTNAQGKYSTALGYYSVTTKDEENVISVGNSTGDYFQRIINVADGINDHDVATYRQIKLTADGNYVKQTALSDYYHYEGDVSLGELYDQNFVLKINGDFYLSGVDTTDEDAVKAKITDLVGDAWGNSTVITDNKYVEDILVDGVSNKFCGSFIGSMWGYDNLADTFQANLDASSRTRVNLNTPVGDNLLALDAAIGTWRGKSGSTEWSRAVNSTERTRDSHLVVYDPENPTTTSVGANLENLDLAILNVEDNLNNNYYTNVEFSMAKNPVKSANDNNFTTLNCVKEA